MDRITTASPPGEPAGVSLEPRSGLLPLAQILETLPVARADGTRQGTDVAVKWGEFLSQWDWQWFATLTFKDPVHPETACKAFNAWTNEVDRARLGGNPNRSRHLAHRCQWVRALEYQKRDVLHFHALVRNLGVHGSAAAERQRWQDWWTRERGFAWVEQPAVIGDVAGYVAKYVSKGGQIDLSPTLQHQRPLAET